MRTVSRKRASLQRRYSSFVSAMLAVDKRCEVGPRIRRAIHHYRGCRRTATGLHHLRKRSAGGALCDPDNVMRSCDPCNVWVEDHPRLARDLGLVVREGDSAWARLGAGRGA
jgi:hypothetical protein